MHQVVRREGLDQPRLQVRALAERVDPDRLGVPPADHDVDGALQATVLARRRAGLHRVGDPGQHLALLLGRQRLDLLLVVALARDDALHQRAVEQPAEGAHVRDRGMVLEPDGVREAAPRQRELRRDRARDRHLERRHRRPELVLVLLEVDRLPLELPEDRLRRPVGREAHEHRQDLQRVDAGGALDRDSCACLGDGGHVRRRGGEQQPGLCELRSPFLVRELHPGRLAARVDVVAAGLQRRLGDGRAVVDARPDGVGDDPGAFEQRRECVDVVLDLHDLVVGLRDAGNFGEHLFDPCVVAPRGDERDVVLAQELDDQPRREAAGAVDDDGTFAHVSSRPSRRIAFSFRISGRTSGLISSCSKSASHRSGVING